ncbi:Nucleotide-diphospho-sugar transferase [Corchorus olitorius]|uniref:Nucleotide-diphospho-sugar transferase n=1 Tax=Corchorus olitorius TaxID=93759 RepID=A0A1R3JDU2_9ROSI|nr:Nucleotide-diphospho-sugar transferase [Corchorus olitorius]
MSDNTIILTIVNEAWARPDSILDLFLESFRIGQGTKRLLNHLLIIAEDSQAFQYCKSRHPHCFHLKNSQTKFTRGNLMISRSKLKLLQQVIDLGYNFAFTNADVMWLRNPITKLVPNVGLSISCDLNTFDNETFGIKGDGGFFHVKADGKTYEFIKSCNVRRVLYPDSEHQSLCNVLATDNYSEFIGMNVGYLDEVNFGRLCRPGDLSQIYTIQANCCENIDSKIHYLKLVLDDWRNYLTELSVQNDSSKRSPLSWRAPQKCV